uniref:Uncharacterized protein n=1 Tax=Salmo trutta TaxID=8032 RepID=A0A673YSZ9_SALTR
IKSRFLLGSGIKDACVVIDVGTRYLKAGFAGADVPSCVIPSVMGLVRQCSLDYKRGYVGSEILENPNICTGLTWDNSIVTEWDAKERLQPPHRHVATSPPVCQTGTAPGPSAGCASLLQGWNKTM